ncbi:hypothetical protein FHX82_006959 [Amycolatopsis bartoniae]|nr:hypothetical protein [Amycolatopsis bartoniae]
MRLVAASGDSGAHRTLWTVIAAMAMASGPRIENRFLTEIGAA